MMPTTYRALLKGNRLEWLEDSPTIPSEMEPIAVYVTIVPDDEKELEERRRRVAEALLELSQSGAFSEIKDPVAWQREIREDRPLYGRDEALELDDPQMLRMTDHELLGRITLDPQVMVGKPVIHGTRLTVEYILNLLGHGENIEDILGEYEGLVVEDIQACLIFASRSLEITDFLRFAAEQS